MTSVACLGRRRRLDGVSYASRCFATSTRDRHTTHQEPSARSRVTTPKGEPAVSVGPPPKVTSRAVRSIDAPVERTWAVLSDHEGMSTWAPWLRVTLDRPGLQTRNGVGAIRRVAPPGPTPAIVEEVTGFEPGVRLAYRGISGLPFRGYEGNVTLTATAAGTQVRYSISVDPRRPRLDKAATRVIAWALLASLSRAVERSQPERSQ